jgi:hypothetical protein
VLWKEVRSKRRGDQDDAPADDDGAGHEGQRMFARAYHVFAAEQVDGADDLIARRADRLTTGTPLSASPPPTPISPDSTSA